MAIRCIHYSRRASKDDFYTENTYRNKKLIGRDLTSSAQNAILKSIIRLTEVEETTGSIRDEEPTVWA